MRTTFQTEIELANLILHSSQLADPTNRFAIAMKEISKIRSKTDADYKKLADLEFTGSLYVNRQNQIILPGRLFEAAIHEGAKISREGKKALASVIVENDPVISYDGGPLSVEELLKSEQHRLVVAVRVQQAKVMRTRPIFENVKAKFIVSFDDGLSDAKSLKNWIETALNQKGIGDWRPRHGRGILTKFEEIKQPLAVAAE